MYITINDIKGEKRIDLSYSIDSDKEIAVIIMLSDNVLYQVKYTEVLLPTGKNVKISEGVYVNEKLYSLIGSEKDKVVPCGHASKINKLEKITKLIFSLNELDNSHNLEDGRPSNTLFTYHVTEHKDFTSFGSVTPQYKKLKNQEIYSLTLRIMDQDNNIMTDDPGATIVLHVCNRKI